MNVKTCVLLVVFPGVHLSGVSTANITSSAASLHWSFKMGSYVKAA
jgi:hypothetical protein